MFRPGAPKKMSDFGDVFEPSEAAEPILAQPVRSALTEWLTEIWAEDELSAVGISARRKAIFDGPPGVGKTTLAHHLAARLGLTMLAVRPERIISKWLGETAANVGELFDFAADPDNPIVIFLDEFDAISRQRRRSEQGSDDERNAYVDTLLQRIEQYRGFLIAATNYAEHIDQAIWRRFEIHVTLSLPGQRERERILSRYFAPYGLPPHALSALAESMETASPALMRAFCEGLKRTLVVGPKLGSDMRRGAVIGRLLETIHPHPDCGKPRLWSLGDKDSAVRGMPWPLPRADEVEVARTAVEPAPASNVVAFGGTV